MTEAHIGFLYNASSVFKQNEFDETHKKLKSYYLMRCKDLTRGYELPKKHFSEETRCSHCLLEWNNKTEIKLKPIKLSKQQRRRIKHNSKHKTSNNKESLLFSNEMVKVCSFCCKSIKTPIIKPNKLLKQATEPNKATEQSITTTTNKESAVQTQKQGKKSKNKKGKHKPEQKYQSNVYCQSKVAFSLNKQKNSLQSTIKVEPKIIKNSKKKKDKFAGLCQKAVMAATKFKEEKENNSKLKLFLKPST